MKQMLNVCLILSVQVVCWPLNAANKPSAAADEKVNAEQYLEIPEEVVDAIFNLRSRDPKHAEKIAVIEQWLAKNPNNKNGVRKHDNGETTLLTDVIGAYKTDPVATPLLKRLLDLEPDVRRADINPVAQFTTRPMYKNALEAMGEVQALFPTITPEHSSLVMKVVDLMVKQGVSVQEIETQLNGIVARLDPAIKRGIDRVQTAQRKASDEEGYYRERLATLQEAKKAFTQVLHDLKAAAIVEKELSEHLGIPDLGTMGAQYVAPVKKKK